MASATGASRIAGLNHEVGDYAVDDDIVVVAPLGQGCEVLACLVSLAS